MHLDQNSDIDDSDDDGDDGRSNVSSYGNNSSVYEVFGKMEAQTMRDPYGDRRKAMYR